ncbi:MAG: LAGLIDADG family homing endonuclease [Anaerolineae bacterium]
MAGKCVRGDTLVFTDGGLRPIADLMPLGARNGEFAAVNCVTQGRQGRQQVTHFYVGGRQATVRVKTRFGYQIEGTPEHRIWIRHPDGTEGWKTLGEVCEGDVVAIQRQIDLWGQDVAIDGAEARTLKRVKRYPLPETLDTDLAYLMGLLIGDGTLTYADSFLLSTADAFIADEFARIMQRLFSYTPGCKANGKDFFVTSQQIRKFLAGLDMGYHQAQDKHVPSSILRAPKPLVVAFLQGLFDTDGYADNRYGNAHLATASERLAREVQLLLLNLGIIASLRVKKTPARPSYEVSISGLDAITFHKDVGFRLPRKRERAALASLRRMPNVGGIPYLAPALKDVQARIVATADKRVALKHVKSVNSIFYTYVPSGRNLTHGKLDELVAYCHQNNVPCPELETLQTTRYFYDPVALIDTGEGDVYDLSVADEHAYVANGMISHNSTYLRQIALVVLMAQIGSFVPAESATLSIVDRIFTRIGAHDEIAQGQSTFMVEMVETANILRHATPRSLVILDEVGRGTSTYDGLSIAWAVVEYLHNNPDLRAKTLFATHYHELTELAERLPRVRNFNVAVAEDGEGVVFLHKIVPGGADRSYGIHVAQLAGLPRAVIHRASEILADLEQEARAPGAPRDTRPMQLALLMTEHPTVSALKELDINQLTPLEAINVLYQLQKKAKE